MVYVNARFLTQPITGVQRFAIEISLQLKKMFKGEIVFVAPKGVPANDYQKELQPEIVGNHTGHLWEQLDLPLFLKKRKATALICLCNTAPILFKKKYVVVHDIAFIRYPSTFAFSFRLLYRILIPLILKTSRQIFSVSEFSAAEITSYYRCSKKICVLHNAVGNSFFKGTPQKEVPERNLLAVSSVKENKNFQFILDVMKAVVKTEKDVKLFVVGDMNAKNFNSVDVDWIKECENICLLGRVSDEELIRLYTTATAFLFPSLYEGFGIPVLEAQACGCPVISSNSASMPEVLKQSAVLLPPNNEKLWEKAIIDLCRNRTLRDELIGKGYENVRRFSWEKSAKILYEAVKKAL